MIMNENDLKQIVPIRGLFNLTENQNILTIKFNTLGFRPHQGII